MSAPPQGLVTDEIEFTAGKIRFYRAGTSGPAIVLLHGGGPDNALLSWRHAFPVLAADHQVFAPDLPGQGGSMPWRGRANQRTFEEVLRWLLDAWQLPAVTLVGMSMGGTLVLGDKIYQTGDMVPLTKEAMLAHRAAGLAFEGVDEPDVTPSVQSTPPDERPRDAAGHIAEDAKAAKR